jgi:hypothetical protein
MWFKKRKEEAAKEQKERELFRLILDDLTKIEKKLLSLEFEVDVLKARGKSKFLKQEKEEEKPKDLYGGMFLPP